MRSAAAVIRGVNAWSDADAFARCSVPTLLLRAELRENPDAIRLRAIKPDLEVGFTVGAGHFHQWNWGVTITIFLLFLLLGMAAAMLFGSMFG